MNCQTTEVSRIGLSTKSELMRSTTRNEKQWKEKKKIEMNLQKEFATAKQLFESDPNTNNANALNLVKEKLELLYEENLQGIIIRARAHWWEHGEKSTKYFLNLEKRNHVVQKLKTSGSIITDPFDILSEQKRFYQELYTSHNKKADNTQTAEFFLNNLNIPGLTEQQRLSCEGKITSNKCAKALETFQLNKAPGNDGIPIEFYRTFWSLISEPFIRCANECFEKGEMSSFQKQAVITHIYYSIPSAIVLSLH